MVIDLRSDTVTRPTQAMRVAMADAEVGDDVFGDDPTVKRLETLAAERVGKAAALFVPSGTMGNLAALLAHCQRGQEVIVGNQAHIYWYEAGGASALGGLIYHPVPTAADGTLALDDLVSAIRPSHGNPHFAPAGVVCLENTHNRMGGVVLSPHYSAAVARFAADRGLPVHLDGARIFNAAVAHWLSVTDWTAHATSVQFCLSKGLGAPIGSILAGPEDFIHRAWRIRKMLGGGMRQVGVIAAAGIIALETMVERLADDHQNARALAESLAALPGVTIDAGRVETNIVIFEPPVQWEPAAFITAAEERGVLLTAFVGRRIRAMTHADVSRADCERAVEVIATIVRHGPPPRPN
jgi:threonine aldolase